MAMDQLTSQIYLVTAEHTTGLTTADGKPLPPIFHPNTFSILRYGKSPNPMSAP
jgi:hypothetical protein